MDLDFSEEQEMLRDMVREFAENEIALRSLMGLWESGQVEELIGLFWPDAVSYSPVAPW